MTDPKPTQGSAQEIEYILASYTDRNGTGCRADLELCISICAEKCSKVPAFVELAEHHYGDHLRMMRRLLDALPALLSARPAPEALPVPSPTQVDTAPMYKALIEARLALAAVNSGASIKALSLIDGVLNAAPEALGAAKGELSDAEILDVAVNYGTKGEQS